MGWLRFDTGSELDIFDIDLSLALCYEYYHVYGVLVTDNNGFWI
jgi:hypothetical protein